MVLSSAGLSRQSFPDKIGKLNANPISGMTKTMFDTEEEILNHLDLAQSVARRFYAAGKRHGLSPDDLWNEAVLALIEVVRRRGPEVENLEAYATVALRKTLWMILKRQWRHQELPVVGDEDGQTQVLDVADRSSQVEQEHEDSEHARSTETKLLCCLPPSETRARIADRPTSCLLRKSV